MIINMMKNLIWRKRRKRKHFKDSKKNKDVILIFLILSLEKIKLAKIDAKFPDEVDTPNDVPARVRFQK